MWCASSLLFIDYLVLMLLNCSQSIRSICIENLSNSSSYSDHNYFLVVVIVIVVVMAIVVVVVEGLVLRVVNKET